MFSTFQTAVLDWVHLDIPGFSLAQGTYTWSHLHSFFCQGREGIHRFQQLGYFRFITLPPTLYTRALGSHTGHHIISAFSASLLSFPIIMYRNSCEMYKNYHFLLHWLFSLSDLADIWATRLYLCSSKTGHNTPLQILHKEPNSTPIFLIHTLYPEFSHLWTINFIINFKR